MPRPRLEVVLADVPPGIGLSITTGRGSSLAQPKQYRGGWICTTALLGRSVSEIRLRLDSRKVIQGVSYAERMLGPEIAEDPQTQDKVLQELKKRGASITLAYDPNISTAVRAALKSVPSSASNCQTCHSTQAKQWRSTKHAH